MTFQIQPANLPFPGLAYEPGKDRKGAEALPHPHAVTTNAGQTLEKCQRHFRQSLWLGALSLCQNEKGGREHGKSHAQVQLLVPRCPGRVHKEGTP